ncbi:cupin [Burkholderiaceae bacterium FT117]|uniref:cupin domain-containing protein n=1 Tax=Zeimonas sediminis TaxID=2944268 RepID=UPI002342CAF5|nr:cupin [Zeimonas sediminis]MCM5569266.1 cupin [Zeimonas sediminis]
MDIEAFKRQLLADGYLEIVEKTMEPNLVIDMHSHPYDVRALVLAGTARIACSGEPEREYGPGDVLEVAAGRQHVERYGPDGYTFLVGRRHPG